MALLKGLGLIILALGLEGAYASRPVGQNEAARVCERASFDRDRMACLNEVRTGRTFDQRALNVCASLSFSNNFAACIRALKNKTYQDFETRECARQSFDQNKISCLEQFGSHGYQQPPMYPQPPNHGGGGHPGYGHPGHGNIYGPAVTRRWVSMGEDKVDKVESVRAMNLRGQLVNEIVLSVTKEKVQVNSVVAYLSNGQAISVYGLNGTIREGQQKRVRLDRKGSVRVERIEVNAVSSLIGSRGVMRVDIGLAQ